MNPPFFKADWPEYVPFACIHIYTHHCDFDFLSKVTLSLEQWEL